MNKNSIFETLRQAKSQMALFGICQIGLFGSYSREDNDDKSDIGLLIHFDSEKETYDNYITAYDFLEDLFENKKIDLVTKNGLSPNFAQSILNEVIYV